MKHNWEYKRLGDVCDVNFGKRIVAKDTEPGQYYVYGGGGATFTTRMFNRENCMIVSRFAMSPECVRYVKGKFFLNDSGLSVASSDKRLLQSFVDKYLWNSQKEIYNLGRGVAQKNLNVKRFIEILLPIPPKETQERIVAELDKINELIEAKREQLKLLDLLAQSIFYTMFGDPVTNPKGWDVYFLDKLGELGRGVSKHRPRNAPELLGGTMPLIQTGDIANAGLYITKYVSTYSELGVAQSKVWPKDTLCITIAANIGKTAITKFPACFPDSVVGFSVDKDACNSLYIYYFFNAIQKDLEDNANGVAQKNINLAILSALKVPLPPLSLQEQFAAKVEAIEAQKATVEKSIAELQTLLDSRMEYWFN